MRRRASKRLSRKGKSLKIKKDVHKQLKYEADKAEEARAAAEAAEASTAGQSTNPLYIRAVQGSKTEYKMSSGMKSGIVPKVNESSIFIGKSGSGKTNLLLYMMQEPTLMPKELFDEVYLFSFTGKCDKSFSKMVSPSNVFSDDLQKNLEDIFERQKQKVEAGDGKPILFILEDITSSTKLIRSPIFTKLYTAGRHYLITIFSLCHKLTSCSKVARVNSNHIFMFPSPQVELKSLR